LRIISSFKDYYDFPQKWGFDPKIVYVRETQLIHDGNNKHLYFTNLFKNQSFNTPTRLFVGFAGKIFEFYVYTYKEENKYFPVKDDTEEERIKAYSKAKEFGHKVTKTLPPKKRGFELSAWQKDWRARQRSKLIESLDLLFEKAPIWLSTGPRWQELNPCFRKYGFENFMEGNQMYQELAQYMSNVWAISQPEIPVPSDKDMVEIKGFDKYSFRKGKTK